MTFLVALLQAATGGLSVTVTGVLALVMAVIALAAMVAHRLGDLEARVRERGPR